MVIKRKALVSFIYIILLILWSSIYTGFRLSNYYNNNESINADFGYNVSRIVFIIIYMVLMIKVVFDFFYSNGKQRIVLLLLTVLFVVSYYHVQNDFLYPAVFFIMSARGVDIKKALKWILYTQIVTVLFVIVSSRIGVIEDGIHIFRDGVYRYSLGFAHPNTLGACLFLISMVTFYFYHKKRQIQVYITLTVSFAICFWVASSRTSALLLLMVIICQIFVSLNQKGFRYINRFSEWVIRNLKFLVPVIVLINILASFGYIRIGLNDTTFQMRFGLAANYLKHYSINLFGRNLYFGDEDTKAGRYVNNNLNYSLTVLDNAYIYLLLGFGVVITFFFFLVYFLRMRKAGVEKDYALIFVLLIYLICGFMETTLIKFYFNYFMLFFADLIWDKATWLKQKRRK